MAAIEKLPLGPISHGLSPHWDPRSLALYFSDFHNGNIYRVDHLTKQTSIISLEKKPVSFIIPLYMHPGHFICGEASQIKQFIWDLESNTPRNVSSLAIVPESKDTLLTCGKCDACGRLWTGTKSSNLFYETVASLYNFTKIKGFVKQTYDFFIPAGLAWDPNNNTMYFSDSLNKCIDSFDFDIVSGIIRNRQVVFDFKKCNIRGAPHGLTTDANGNLWVACYESAQVVNINPEVGTVLNTLHLPTNQITSVTFGGRYLEELYITTARNYFTNFEMERYIDAGSVYKVTNLNVKGRRTHDFVAD